MTWPYSWPSTWPTSTGQNWDDGITWFTRVVTSPTTRLIDLQFATNQILRVVNDDADADMIESLIRQAAAAAEEMTGRAVAPQTLAQVMSGFPSGGIVLQRPPLIEVVSLEYYDANGDLQSLAGSPAEYLLMPSGRKTKAEIRPLVDASWPSTQTRQDAVTVTFRAGFEDMRDPECERITYGMGLWIGEAYKQRSLGVQAPQTPSQFRLEQFWTRVY
jgi:uncharacterized phiE125 gp8 family phage protein